MTKEAMTAALLTVSRRLRRQFHRERGQAQAGGAGQNQELTWLVVGVLLLAWALAAVVWFGSGEWLHLDQGAARGARTGASTLTIGSLLVLGASFLAWLSYRLGGTQSARQSQMERRYRHALEEAYRGTLSALTSVLDQRDDETYGHSRRVMGYSVALGKRLGLSREQVQTLAWGALIHDLGKIGIRDNILLKDGPLTDDERAQMNEHVVIGWHLVQNVPFLTRTATLIRHHHERYDGQGYPDRLIGEAIPLEARIFAVADAFDAMTSVRPYRRTPLAMDAAMAVIQKGAGGQFCPVVAAAFAAIPLAELEQIRAASFMPLEDTGPLVNLEEEVDGYSLHIYRDALTGTQNRTAWEMKRSQMATVRGAELGTVVYCDLDGLKGVNDTHEHAAGDRVLADMGARLLQMGPEVYRMGGDEFILWFPEGAWRAATHRRLQEVVTNFAAYWSHLIPGVSASWGVSTATGQTRCLSELVSEADRAMYVHKAERRTASV